MGSVKFTKEQKHAIDTLDKSILVAAAAGSGKTAVLVQRIINIILSGEANVDEMLVVTFTNAAASEMKLKISKEIKKRLSEECSDQDRKKLKNQLDRLYRSYISTFNSFEVRVIKEFFYEVDIEPNFNVCDEIQSSMLQMNSIDEVFEMLFAKDDYIEGCSFKEFLQKYSSDRSEEGIKASIIGDYAKLRSMPNYFEWAKDMTEKLLMTSEDFAGSDLSKELLGQFLRVIDESIDGARTVRRLFYDAGLAVQYEEKLMGEIPMIENLKVKAEKYGFSKELFELLGTVSFESLPSFRKNANDSQKQARYEIYQEIKDEVQAVRKSYKDAINGWIKNNSAASIETQLEEMHQTYKYTRYYLSIIETFEEVYVKLKKDDKLLDFGDMDHYASVILGNPSVRETLRNRFKFIFIDEYQDTNNIQEHLISQISRSNNVFKVGDVKQSIYGFRQADPSIFESVYADYEKDEKECAEVVDLNNNFRSNLGTINYVNKVFDKIMDGYDERAKLYQGGSPWPEELVKYDFIPDVYVLETEQEDLSSDEDYDEDGDDSDSELRDLSNSEAEAKEVANIVKNLVGTEFYDSKEGVVRNAEPRDIVVLLRGVKSRGDYFMRAMKNANIDSHIEEGESLFDATEIRIAVSLLQTIDNMKRDIPLIATLHSEIMGFESCELGQIRAEHKAFERTQKDKDIRRTPYWEALEWYAENGSDKTLATRIQKATSQLLEWRNLSILMPVPEFIWKVLIDSNYYMYAGAMYGGSRRQANLRTLVDRATALSETQIMTLSTYLDYVEVLRTKKVKNGQVAISGKEDNLVKIMTIHKSKGLEYPFVIVAGLGSRVSLKSDANKLSFDSKLGLGIDYVSPNERYYTKTLIQKAIKAKAERDYLAEELRVLYVAMTRARNKLILTGISKSREDAIAGNGPQSFYRIIHETLETPFNKLHSKPLEKTDAWTTQSLAQKFFEARSESAESKENDLYKKVASRLEYQYPDKEALNIKAKFSVSELMNENGKAEMPDVDFDKYASPIRIVQYKKDGPSDSSLVGTAYHRLLEFLDFQKTAQDGKVSMEYITERLATLITNGVIEGRIAEMINLDHVAKFFESPIGQRVINAALRETLEKEKPFTMKYTVNGTEVLLQGVIDCCFEEDGEMVIVDYKTNRLREGADFESEVNRLQEEYKSQLELYANAVENGTGKRVKEAQLYLFAINSSI